MPKKHVSKQKSLQKPNDYFLPQNFCYITNTTFMEIKILWVNLFLSKAAKILWCFRLINQHSKSWAFLLILIISRTFQNALSEFIVSFYLRSRIFRIVFNILQFYWWHHKRSCRTSCDEFYFNLKFFDYFRH